jgi:hypothetical protein
MEELIGELKALQQELSEVESDVVPKASTEKLIRIAVQLAQQCHTYSKFYTELPIKH